MTDEFHDICCNMFLRFSLLFPHCRPDNIFLNSYVTQNKAMNTQVISKINYVFYYCVHLILIIFGFNVLQVLNVHEISMAEAYILICHITPSSVASFLLFWIQFHRLCCMHVLHSCLKNITL